MTETVKRRRRTLRRRLRNAGMDLYNWWTCRTAVTDGVLVARESGHYVLEIGVSATLRHNCLLSIHIGPAHLRHLADQATEVLAYDGHHAERNT